MAKGKKCRECGSHMYAANEKYEEKGTFVTYTCTNSNCNWTERVFESN